MARTYSRPYIGLVKTLCGFRYEYFRSTETPTAESHGHRYAATIGPFRTARAARWGCAHPGFATVADAEELSA